MSENKGTKYGIGFIILVLLISGIIATAIILNDPTVGHSNPKMSEEQPKLNVVEATIKSLKDEGFTVIEISRTTLWKSDVRLNRITDLKTIAKKHNVSVVYYKWIPSYVTRSSGLFFIEIEGTKFYKYVEV